MSTAMKLMAIALLLINLFCCMDANASGGKPAPVPSCTFCDDKYNAWTISSNKYQATELAGKQFVNINTCEKSSSRKKKTWCFMSDSPVAFPIGTKTRYIGVVAKTSVTYVTGGTKTDNSYWYADTGRIYGFLNGNMIQETTNNPAYGYKDKVCIHFLGKRKLRFSLNGVKVGPVVKMQNGQFYASYYVGAVGDHSVICTWKGV